MNTDFHTAMLRKISGRIDKQIQFQCRCLPFALDSDPIHHACVVCYDPMLAQLLNTTTISSTLNLENVVVYFVTFRLLRVARLMIAFPEMRIVMTTFGNIGEACMRRRVLPPRICHPENGSWLCSPLSMLAWVVPLTSPCESSGVASLVIR